MHTFPDLIKKIRKEVGMTQAEFAKSLGVSTVLVSMIETGQKEVSKKLLTRIADRLDVHPSSITPFLFTDNCNDRDLSGIEASFLQAGEKLQNYLIKNRAKRLREYVS